MDVGGDELLAEPGLRREVAEADVTVVLAHRRAELIDTVAAHAEGKAHVVAAQTARELDRRIARVRAPEVARIEDAQACLAEEIASPFRSHLRHRLWLPQRPDGDRGPPRTRAVGIDALAHARADVDDEVAGVVGPPGPALQSAFQPRSRGNLPVGNSRVREQVVNPMHNLRSRAQQLPRAGDDDAERRVGADDQQIGPRACSAQRLEAPGREHPAGVEQAPRRGGLVEAGTPDAPNLDAVVCLTTNEFELRFTAAAVAGEGTYTPTRARQSGTELVVRSPTDHIVRVQEVVQEPDSRAGRNSGSVIC